MQSWTFKLTMNKHVTLFIFISFVSVAFCESKNYLLETPSDSNVNINEEVNKENGFISEKRPEGKSLNFKLPGFLPNFGSHHAIKIPFPVLSHLIIHKPRPTPIHVIKPLPAPIHIHEEKPHDDHHYGNNKPGHFDNNNLYRPNGFHNLPVVVQIRPGISQHDSLQQIIQSSNIDTNDQNALDLTQYPSNQYNFFPFGNPVYQSVSSNDQYHEASNQVPQVTEESEESSNLEKIGTENEVHAKKEEIISKTESLYGSQPVYASYDPLYHNHIFFYHPVSESSHPTSEATTGQSNQIKKPISLLELILKPLQFLQTEISEHQTCNHHQTHGSKSERNNATAEVPKLDNNQDFIPSYGHPVRIQAPNLPLFYPQTKTEDSLRTQIQEEEKQLSRSDELAEQSETIQLATENQDEIEKENKEEEEKINETSTVIPQSEKLAEEVQTQEIPVKESEDLTLS